MEKRLGILTNYKFVYRDIAILGLIWNKIITMSKQKFSLKFINIFFFRDNKKKRDKFQFYHLFTKY